MALVQAHLGMAKADIVGCFGRVSMAWSDEDERIDALWEAGLEDRWLGDYQSLEGDDEELMRVAIIGSIEGRWFATIWVVDGDRCPHDLQRELYFDRLDQARAAWRAMR